MIGCYIPFLGHPAPYTPTKMMESLEDSRWEEIVVSEPTLFLLSTLRHVYGFTHPDTDPSCERHLRAMKLIQRQHGDHVLLQAFATAISHTESALHGPSVRGGVKYLEGLDNAPNALHPHLLKLYLRALVAYSAMQPRHILMITEEVCDHWINLNAYQNDFYVISKIHGCLGSEEAWPITKNHPMLLKLVALGIGVSGIRPGHNPEYIRMLLKHNPPMQDGLPVGKKPITAAGWICIGRFLFESNEEARQAAPDIPKLAYALQYDKKLGWKDFRATVQGLQVSLYSTHPIPDSFHPFVETICKCTGANL